METELLEPVVNGGTRLTHFFNGRVLTAEDLRREQDAARDLRRGLAGAAGEGVVRGLQVTAETRTPASPPAAAMPTVRVTAGLAFNRDGDPVALPRDVELRLIPARAAVDAEAGLFALCDAPAVQADITNAGFYLLAARPASVLSRARVPSVELASDGVGTGCGSRYAELGASFSLVPVPLPPGGADAPLARRLTELSAQAGELVERVRGGETGQVLVDLARTLSLLRSGMAYWCAGRDAAGHRVASLAVPAPGTPAPPPLPLEVLRAAGFLGSCDVPLALLLVTRRGLEWVDNWAVRRPPVPRLEPDPLALVADALLPADAAAAFMQFREHAAAFFAADAPVPAHQVRAAECFLFLPPAGILPLAAAGRAGFDRAAFFAGRPVTGPAPLAAARVPPLLRTALLRPPVDLSAQDRCWLYEVTEMRAPGAPHCLLFTSYPLEPDLVVQPTVRITDVVPGGTVQVGQPLRVTGENFEAAIGAHRAFLDATRVQVFTSASDGELVFDVPELPGLPEGGRSVLLTVSNRTTSAYRSIVVQPRPEPLQGNVDVEYESVTPQTPAPGQAVTFTFRLRNRTNKAVQVALTPTVSVTAWQPLLQVLPTAQATTPVTSVDLALGQERTVFVRITALPGDSAGTSFTVRLDGAAGGITGSSGPQSFQVGTPAEVPDPAVASLALTFTIPEAALQQGVVRVPATSSVVRVGFNVVVNQPASYVVTARFVNAQGEQVTLTGWTLGIVDQQAPGQRTFPVTEADLAATGSTALTPQVALIAASGAAAAGEVLVRVQRTGQTQKRELRFGVARA